MKERPILFSAPMVRAILDGTKTQTRRIVTPQFAPDAVPAEMCAETAEGWQTTGHSGLWWCDAAGCADDAIRCPYGTPGDWLWVKETFYAYGRWETRYNTKKGRDEWNFVDLTVPMDRLYQFSDPTPGVLRHRRDASPAWWKRPAIFMPRAASRVLLEVTGVRVERLQDISGEDAVAEGIVPHIDQRMQLIPGRCIDSYRALWEQINGPGSWEANPWVWVVEFRQIGQLRQAA